ncbi:hypothetical protein E3Q17_01027 [Wallemia mellicola]|uniref:Mitochondrial import inner membrane translocase subunit TIM54 n=1 Tax=Wallemia mellicola TaxID=1708541 RepID=A0A4T0NZE6_9BASI|nr:hypothetical protein E3Q17_01027 [Wallemia mellicola]
MSKFRESLRILTYVGVPESVINWKPRLPSRNWCIFLGITGSTTALYAYDRRETKRIMQEYKDRVIHLSQEPIGGPSQLPRRVHVYAALYPEYDEPSAAKFFKFYIKPILNAAAMDYIVEKGHRHGALATTIRERIQAERRETMGLEPASMPPKAVESQRDREGGVVLIGRHTVKEYLAGLAQGWKSGVISRDLLAELSKVVPSLPKAGEEDTLKEYAELETVIPEIDIPVTGASTGVAKYLTSAPAVIPPQPPVLLVPFVELVGFSKVPEMLMGFFNHRAKARLGGEAAMKLINPNLQKVEPPYAEDDEEGVSYDEPWKQPQVLEFKPQGGTLCGFDVDSEMKIKKTFEDVPKGVARRRKEYYDNLIEKLKKTREQASRELKENERKEKSEEELQQERIAKEKAFREEYEGWALARKNSKVRYEPWMNGLHVYS